MLTSDVNTPKIGILSISPYSVVTVPLKLIYVNGLCSDWQFYLIQKSSPDRNNSYTCHMGLG